VNSEKINDLVNKIPISFLMFCYLGYLAFDYYTFENDPASPLLSKKTEIAAAKENNTKLENKLKQSSEFVKTLEQKKLELRRIAQDLQDVKGTLSETIDVPAFMKMVITEAKKVGLTVSSLKPMGSSEKEYYAEHVFLLSFRGVFVQLAAFLERLANVSQVVRVDSFSMKPIGSSKSKYVDLEGTVEIKSYRYLGSKADSIGSADSPASEAPAGKGPAKQGEGS
jgi:type IV pilus assembly protein PilO